MSDDQPTDREKTLIAMQACVTHARDLLTAAKAVMASGQPHIAYHLATLTLEELGRRELIALRVVASKSEVPPAWPEKHTQDHVKKLFWCFFGGGFLANQLNKEGFVEATDLAERVHSNRIAGLYVDAADDGIGIPSDAIVPEHAEALVKLAEVRLKMAELEQPRGEIQPAEAELQQWFLRATEDREKQRQVLSKPSLDKLAELKSPRAWGLWLKEQFEKAEREGREMAEAELKRSQNLPIKGAAAKWKFRIRILSASHSIRPKVLSEWNSKVRWIKLSSNQKNELLVEFTLKDNVPVEALWFFGWGLARQFVVALNIATRGFWWWRLPEQISRYYDRLEDLQNKSRFVVERSPALKVNWGENRVLSATELAHLTVCFVCLPGPDKRDQHAPYNYYVGGLTFLSLNDIHWQCEVNIFGNFHQCMKAMLQDAGELSSGVAYDVALAKFIDAEWPDFDDRNRYCELARLFEANGEKDAKVTLSEAAFMKFLCDIYFWKKVVPSAMAAKKAAGLDDIGDEGE
jgi:AbiV family abortive infection protein